MMSVSGTCKIKYSDICKNPISDYIPKNLTISISLLDILHINESSNILEHEINNCLNNKYSNDINMANSFNNSNTIGVKYGTPIHHNVSISIEDNNQVLNKRDKQKIKKIRKSLNSCLLRLTNLINIFENNINNKNHDRFIEKHNFNKRHTKKKKHKKFTIIDKNIFEKKFLMYCQNILNILKVYIDDVVQLYKYHYNNNNLNILYNNLNEFIKEYKDNNFPINYILKYDGTLLYNYIGHMKNKKDIICLPRKIRYCKNTEGKYFLFLQNDWNKVINNTNAEALILLTQARHKLMNNSILKSLYCN